MKIKMKKFKIKNKNVPFLRFYRVGICRLAEFASFANRNEQRGEAVYPQGKAENGGGEFDSLAPDSGADTRSLHEGAEQRGLQDIPRYNERLEATLSSQSRGVGMWHPHSVDLALCTTHVRHADFGGWYSDREHRQDDGTRLHCQHANLRPNHRQEDFKGHGQSDTTKGRLRLNKKDLLRFMEQVLSTTNIV